MRKSSPISQLLLVLLMGNVCLPVAAAAQPVVSMQLVSSCEACHGPGGNSQRTDVPRLNGQQESYLRARLREFLDPTRSTPHGTKMMWENAQSVSDDQAAALARYFSRQMPTKANGFGPSANRGAEIFLKGADPDIPACSTCHGSDGGGLGSTPRIAGQHANYLTEQLEAFRLATRAGSPMNRHAWDMDSGQIHALSIFLSND